MPAYLVTYELNRVSSRRSTEFVEHAQIFGWSPWVDGAPHGLLKLPSSALHGNFIDRNVAMDAFKRAVQAANRGWRDRMAVDKWIISDYSVTTFQTNDVQAYRQLPH